MIKALLMLIACALLIGCASVPPQPSPGAGHSLDGYDADTTPGCNGEGWR